MKDCLEGEVKLLRIHGPSTTSKYFSGIRLERRRKHNTWFMGRK